MNFKFFFRDIHNTEYSLVSSVLIVNCYYLTHCDYDYFFFFQLHHMYVLHASSIHSSAGLFVYQCFHLFILLFFFYFLLMYLSYSHFTVVLSVHPSRQSFSYLGFFYVKVNHFVRGFSFNKVFILPVEPTLSCI